MQPIDDYFIVALSELENTKLNHGSLELEAATFLKPLKFARTYGRVVAVPPKLSTDNRYNLALKDRGFPEPKFGIGSDWIQTRENCGDTNMGRHWYSIAGGVPQFKVMADFRWYEGMVEPGDTLYFHYHANQPENILKRENGEIWLKVRFDQAICAVCHIDGWPVITPLADHVLMEQIGESWEDITNSFGLITTTTPKTFTNIGMLQHIDFAAEEELDVTVGDTIVIQSGSLNFEMEIEGTKYFVMKERELHMKIENGTPKPIGDRVVLRPESTEERTASGIIIPDTAKERTYIAEVLEVGKKVEDAAIQVGEKVLYAKDSGVRLEYEGKQILIVRESDIACTI